ncbi:PadR family transcriptional regulator [Plantactinospora sp. GCM10030261]|uniref:PadR family transcriptional regulator n=1 Tax=Plantactinospora sp. GCM10030261 TaxID=3273420 RepID=UPI0036195114
MSATRMMILGLVKWMQPVHGYDVRRELLSWNADKWANVQPGSIYHALRKLTEEELLRAVATEQVGARPARTTYEITNKGIDAFEGMLRELWWELRQPADPFLAAFSFLPVLPREEAVAALRNRARMLAASVASVQASVESFWIQSKPTNVAWMMELWIARGEAEAAWCERVADQIEAGVSYLPVELSPGEGWAGWRDQVRQGATAEGPGAADGPASGAGGANADSSR